MVYFVCLVYSSNNKIFITYQPKKIHIFQDIMDMAFKESKTTPIIVIDANNLAQTSASAKCKFKGYEGV